ncbi:hypothetical protein ABZ570_01520 [Micromonospora sp. NPDC007271]|uniref:hypothetical protein n=1 Tax=Micromonospora sp. NPDC007271 TaxID=3154587 RepID=UPI0033D541B1
MDEARDIAERCVAISRAAYGRGDLDAAINDLHRLPDDLPVRGVLAADLLAALMRSGPMLPRYRLRHLDDLLAITERHPPGTPDWPTVTLPPRGRPLTPPAQVSLHPQLCLLI